MAVKKVALLPAGGLAPCLSSAVGRLIEQCSERSPDTEIIAYINGYKGLLQGCPFPLPLKFVLKHPLYAHGGSPIGNSRVKLTIKLTARNEALLGR